MSAVSAAKFLYGMSSSLLAAASSRAELPAARHRGCAVADPQVTHVLSGFMTWPGSIARRGESRVAERRRRVPPPPEPTSGRRPHQPAGSADDLAQIGRQPRREAQNDKSVSQFAIHQRTGSIRR